MNDVVKCMELLKIPLRVEKTKTKVIKTANQKKGKYPEEPMRSQSQNYQTASSAGKCGQSSCDWLREGCEFSAPITE